MATANEIFTEQRRSIKTSCLLETPPPEFELPEVVNPKSHYEDLINEKSQQARQHENEDYGELLKNAMFNDSPLKKPLFSNNKSSLLGDAPAFHSKYDDYSGNSENSSYRNTPKNRTRSP